MSSGLPVIRFARTERANHSTIPSAVVVARVLINADALESGVIAWVDAKWEYVLADGSRSGLASELSRQDLEGQIALYHFGPISRPAAASSEGDLPLAM